MQHISDPIRSDPPDVCKNQIYPLIKKEQVYIGRIEMVIHFSSEIAGQNKYLTNNGNYL